MNSTFKKTAFVVGIILVLAVSTYLTNQLFKNSSLGDRTLVYEKLFTNGVLDYEVKAKADGYAKVATAFAQGNTRQFCRETDGTYKINNVAYSTSAEIAAAITQGVITSENFILYKAFFETESYLHCVQVFTELKSGQNPAEQAIGFSITEHVGYLYIPDDSLTDENTNTQNLRQVYEKIEKLENTPKLYKYEIRKNIIDAE